MAKTIHDPRYIELIARLRAARKQRELSQTELAARVGKPQSYIAKVETCERRIDLIEALAICRALEIKLDAIVPSELQSSLRSE